nr:hypothetical protein [Acidovorax sp. 69]
MKAPAVPGVAGQLHAVEQPQQLVGRKRDVVFARLPVMQSALSDVKKLRATGQIQAQVAVHGFEPKRKLGAGVRVMATMALAIFN